MTHGPCLCPQVGAGESADITIHAVRVEDAANGLQVSITGRPLNPMLVMLVPGAGWKRLAGILGLIFGPILLSVGVIGGLWACGK